MSTITQPVPAFSKCALTERDFKVCESCSAPAATHPRYELTSYGYQSRPEVLCCACLHGSQVIGTRKTATRKRQNVFEINDQVWMCVECDGQRKWGEDHPADRLLRPALRCDPCNSVTRHRYLSVFLTDHLDK